MSRSPLTTHILDTSRGRPAAKVAVRLHGQRDGAWVELAEGTTDDDGRIGDLIERDAFTQGIYRLTFATGAYFAALGASCFYPEVQVVFEVQDPSEHHHVPLLLNPFGFSTYRGS